MAQQVTPTKLEGQWDLPDAPETDKQRYWREKRELRQLHELSQQRDKAGLPTPAAREATAQYRFLRDRKNGKYITGYHTSEEWVAVGRG